MTHQLIELIERVKSWPVERQKDAARLLEAMEESGTKVYRLSADERRAVDVGLDQAKRGEFVSDADLKKFRRRRA
jgi:hypothetical protein